MAILETRFQSQTTMPLTLSTAAAYVSLSSCSSLLKADSAHCLQTRNKQCTLRRVGSSMGPSVGSGVGSRVGSRVGGGIWVKGVETGGVRVRSGVVHCVAFCVTFRVASQHQARRRRG